MNRTVQQYANAIEQAKLGDQAAKTFLRLRLKTTSQSMPEPLLIALSEKILEYRRKELRTEAERN